MSVSVHLTFAGQCEAAFAFYARCLDGILPTKIHVLAYRDTPMAEQVPADFRDKIVHGSITIAGTTLAGADLQPADYAPPRGFFVLLDIADVTHAERVFDALADGGAVQMPIQQTFWAARFGALVNRFGIPWEINSSAA